MTQSNVDDGKQEAVKQAQKIVSANCQDAILKMDTSDGGNADAFVAMYGDQFKYVREIGWLHWNGKYWEQDDSAVMLAMRESFSVRYHRLYDCEEDNKAKLFTGSFSAIRSPTALLLDSLDVRISDALPYQNPVCRGL